MSINRVCISGNLTRDPELRATQGGTQILGFGVAVNDRRKNPQTGQWEDYPNFIDVSVFGNRAESLSHILAKGMKVAVEGKLRYSSWQAKDGSKRSRIEVIADEVELPPRQQGQGQGRQPVPAQPGYQQRQSYAAPAPQPTYAAPAPQRGYQQQPAQQSIPYQTAPEDDLYDADIPF